MATYRVIIIREAETIEIEAGSAKEARKIAKELHPNALVDVAIRMSSVGREDDQLREDA